MIELKLEMQIKVVPEFLKHFKINKSIHNR